MQATATSPRAGRRWMLRPLALAAAVVVAGCASTPDEIPALQTAEAEYTEATRTARIEEFARPSMQRAEQNLRQAQALAEEGGDQDDIEHYAYLSQRYVEIAEARLNRGLIQEEIQNADRRRQELMLAAEERQSERRATQATEAEQRAEEAEARLALTEQQLQQAEQTAQNLSKELEDMKVEQDERGTVLTLSDVVFDLNSDELNRGGERSVERIAEALNKYPEGKIVIAGYTDSSGSESYNEDLSKRRANSVKEIFVSKGIPEDRLEVEGYGESYPVATNDTPQGRQMNRRVEIVVTPPDAEATAQRRSPSS